MHKPTNLFCPPQRACRGSNPSLPFRKHNTLPVVGDHMSEITFQQEFMINPSATQSA